MVTKSPGSGTKKVKVDFSIAAIKNDFRFTMSIKKSRGLSEIEKLVIAPAT